MCNFLEKLRGLKKLSPHPYDAETRTLSFQDTQTLNISEMRCLRATSVTKQIDQPGQ